MMGTKPAITTTTTAREREIILESDSRARMSNSPLCSLNTMAGGGGRGKKTSATSCCSKVGLKRGPWTAEEDELLAQYIKREGEGRWGTLPKKAGLLRCGKSCRLRWMNYLRPTIKRGHITSDEEDLIIRLHRLLGNRWSLIAGRIPGRTDNEIKNYWNTHLKKKLMTQGIDPRTHRPLNSNPSVDHMNVSSSKAVNDYSTNPSYQTDTPFSIGNGMVHSVDNHLGHGRKDSDPNKDFGNMGISCSEDGIPGFPTDESFSSFLNSLINDDVFNNNNNTSQHQEPEQDQLQVSSSLI